MPSGWSKKTLVEIAVFLDGKRVPLKEADRQQRKGKYPYYGASGIIDFINDYIFDEPLILLGEDGENIVSRNLPLAFKATGKFWVNNHAHVIKPNNDMDIDFLTNYLESLNYEKFNSGTAQPKLNKSACEGIPVLIPPKKEQEKIAKILSTWDEAIEKIDSAIFEKQRKKTYVLERAFNEIRAKKRFKRLSDLADILTSNVDKKSHAGETPVHLCNYVDVYKNHKITAHLSFMEATATPSEVQKFTVFKNDVIITKDSETPQDIAIPAFVAEEIDNLVCGYHLTLIRCDSSQILGHYLYYYFLTVKSKYYFFTMANGATRFGLSLDSISDCEVPITQVADQKKVIDALETIESEIELLGKLKKSLQIQKRGLMQQLLTGKKRVKV